MSVIMVEACDLWDYCEEHADELKASMHEIATHQDYGVNIYITMDTGKPELVVEADDEEVYREHIVDSVDCRETAERIYDTYLTSKAVDFLAPSDYMESSQQEEIDARELELDDAVYDFYSSVLGGIPYYAGDDETEMLEDLKEHFLEYMARKWGIEIYRPMMLEDEDGEEFYEEYPYSCMEFEDEDNPIYAKQAD